MRDKLQEAWFSKQKWVWLLAPLTVLFFFLSKLRVVLYKFGVFKQIRAQVPVIVVGNIGIGGNGKTPIVLALAEYLKKSGLNVVVLSRGYGGSQQEFPYLVGTKDKASLVGDEPALIARRNLCNVVIDPKRTRALNFIQEHLNCDIIVCDDGMQHYALARDVEICVIDKRGVGNGYLLPMGPLRESKTRLKTVDFIIENQGTQPNNEHLTLVPSAWLNLLYSSKTHAINLVPLAWINVFNQRKLSIFEFYELATNQNLPITAMAGIGDPKRFFDTLCALNIDAQHQVGLPDHYDFREHDIPTNQCVLMTEKDAVKCVEFAHENCWFLEIGTNMSEELLRSIKETIELNVQSNLHTNN